MNKCETLDNDVQGESPSQSQGKSPSSASSLGDASRSPKQAEAKASTAKQADLASTTGTTNAIDSILQAPLFGSWESAVQDGAEPSLGVDDADGLVCDGLWDLQDGSGDALPDLVDLCSQSPGSMSGSQRGSFDFGSSASAADIPLFSAELSTGQYGSSVVQDFSPSALVRSYPPAARSPKPPNLNFMSISRPLNNPSWTLIEYYFKEVAALFSSYDSPMNPFRSTVSRLWGSSLALCRTMQSMAAATLVNDFPHFGPLGLKMRDEAADIVSREAVLDDKSRLALLMLGLTSSWHDPADLGVSLFNQLRKHLNATPSDGAGPMLLRSNSSSDYRFFEEALIYWEMLLSFVADDDAVVLSGSAATGLDESIVLQRVPHPWTGIARDAQFTVQEVGRLVRRERKRARACRFTCQEDIAQAQMAMDRGRELEERLLGLAHPSEAEIVSPGDDDTPVWHLLTIAEVYRCTGLVQLYRVFPDLLRRRLPWDDKSELNGREGHDAAFSDLAAGFGGSDSSSDSNPASRYNAWLTEFAMTTLSRLKTIPQESRTRCLQPFLLVGLSSELRLPGQTSHDSGPDSVEVSAQAIEVSQQRRLVVGRLAWLRHVLPPKPIEVCQRLVREVWRRMDGGERGVYWLDVMMEQGWETTMG